MPGLNNRATPAMLTSAKSSLGLSDKQGTKAGVLFGLEANILFKL